MLLKTIFIIALTYLGISVITYFWGPRLAFPAPSPSYADTEDILKFTLPDGTKISALHLNNKHAHFTILYSHGNGEDIGYIRPHMEELRKAGFSVITYDYPGYGTSEGAPGEQNIYDSIFSTYNDLTENQKILPEQIILYGFSIGGGPTLELATKKDYAGIILQSTFKSAFQTLTFFKLFPGDFFKNIEKIDKLRAPLLQIHGKLDGIVHFGHAISLYKKANGPKEHFWVNRSGHNNLVEVAGDAYWNRMKAFADSLPQ